jgi:hypothetical protein
MEKLFTVGGISKGKGVTKVRFANDMTRVKVLTRTGSTDVELFEMSKPMTKAEIVTHLKTLDLYNNAEWKEAIDIADAKYNPTVKIKASKVKPSMEDLKARANAKDTSVQDILSAVEQ